MSARGTSGSPLPRRSEIASPAALGAVGRAAGGGVWVRLPAAALAPPWLPFRSALRPLLGHRTVFVPHATVGVGLAVHALARDVLSDGPGTRAAFDAVLAGWLPAGLCRALRRTPAGESVALALRLLDGEPESAGDTPTPAATDRDDSAGATDWLLSLQRFADATGSTLAEVLETVPWRAFPAEAARAEVVRAMRLRDAALAASAGMGGGEAADAVLDAVARAYALAGLGDRPAPSSPEAAKAGIRRMTELFGFQPDAPPATA